MTLVPPSARAKAVIAATSLTAILTATAAFAAISGSSTGLDATATAGGVRTTTDLGTLVGRLIGGALGLLGIVLVVMIIYAGFLWMTAAGSDEKVKQAKKIIANSVAGLVLIFASYAIVNFVISAIDESNDPIADGGTVMTCSQQVAAGLRSPPCP